MGERWHGASSSPWDGREQALGGRDERQRAGTVSPACHGLDGQFLDSALYVMLVKSQTPSSLSCDFG